MLMDSLLRLMNGFQRPRSSVKICFDISDFFGKDLANQTLHVDRQALQPSGK